MNFNNLSTKRKTVAIVLLICIIATYFIIYGSSMKSPKESGDLSQSVTDAIKPILDADNSIPDDVFEFRLRKFAHFFEFMVLSVEITVLYIILQKTPPCLTHSLIIVFLIMASALLDETLQIFSQRGSAVTDVWIDSSGGITGTVLTSSLYLLKKLLTKKT